MRKTLIRRRFRKRGHPLVFAVYPLAQLPKDVDPLIALQDVSFFGALGRFTVAAVPCHMDLTLGKNRFVSALIVFS